MRMSLMTSTNLDLCQKLKKEYFIQSLPDVWNFGLSSLPNARLINTKCHQVEQQMPDSLPCSGVYQLPLPSRYSASLALIRALM